MKNSLREPKALNYRISNEPEVFCELIESFFKKKHEDQHEKNISEAILNRIADILFGFKIVPGTDWNGAFNKEVFRSWVTNVKEWAKNNDRLDVTLQKIGEGLSYAEKDADELVNDTIMNELDQPENFQMRRGYCLGIINQRGLHFVDETGHTDRKIAKKYRGIAEKAENRGYSRYADALRDIAKDYDDEAKYNVALKEKESERADSSF